MAEKERGADWNAQARQRAMQTLLRLAAWGSLATFALFTAVISAYSSAGRAPADQETVRPRSAAGGGAIRDSDNAEVRHLADLVRVLAADRDQALARIATLERNLDGITGSVRRASGGANSQSPVQQMAQPVAPLAPTSSPPPESLVQASAPPAAWPEAQVLPLQVTIMPAPAPAPPPQQPAARPATAAPQPPTLQPIAQSLAADPPREATPERVAALPSIPARAATAAPPADAPTAGIGLDVGGAINYDGLRTLWHSTKSSDPSLMEELYPLVAARENNKTHGIDLRLVVGPIDDMETASRLCAALMAAHRYCQPVAFEGQRLTINEPPAVKPALVRRPALSRPVDATKPEPSSKSDSRSDSR